MVPRLRFLNAAGFAVLAIDFQPHGMSGGRAITLGALELFDAGASVGYPRARLPDEKVGAVAITLGGAAALVGDEPLNVDALALELVYPDIRRATVNRFAFFLGRFGEWLADATLAHGRARAMRLIPCGGDLLRVLTSPATRRFRCALRVRVSLCGISKSGVIVQPSVVCSDVSRGQRFLSRGSVFGTSIELSNEFRFPRLPIESSN